MKSDDATDYSEQGLRMLLYSIIYGIVSIFFSFIFSYILLVYWAFYDIGINGSANLLSILFFVLPGVALAVFLEVFVVDRMLAARNIGIGKRTVIVTLVTLVLLVFLFLWQVWEVREYPTPQEGNFGDFLRYLFGMK